MADDQKKNPVLPLDETISKLPPPVPSTNLAAEIQQLPHDKLPILVVLDDDPTGTQTCHGINVLTVWDAATLEAEFQSGNRGFFILTNSRALPTQQARNLIHNICTAVKDAATKTKKTFEFVLRGDSTLRGHFPDEPEIAEQVSGKADAWILAPFFRQGGRYTINNVHYVLEGGSKLVPAAQTPFAKDATFGYENSNLVDYVVEKSKGSIPAERVKSISLEDIRVGGPNAVTQKLLGFEKCSVVVLNAIVDTDMEIAVQGLLQATAQGKRYLYRTGAAFVSTRLGIEQIPPLSATELELDQSQTSPGGLILAGSYVPKTTEQLECLIEGRGDKLKKIVLDVEELLANKEKLGDAVSTAVDLAGEYIIKGEDVLVMTSRKLVTGKDEISSLDIGGVVAAALVLFLRLLIPRPRYIIAKGGITSSDAATKSLKMRRAEIRGQAAPGVPLWRCTEPTSKFSGITYVVFPGNVGEKHTLRDLVASWARFSTAENQIKKMTYQRLGKSALKVSRIILGCMVFGDPNWEGSPWTLGEEDGLKLLKKAYDSGINTWDTADTYSNGMSEIIIGKALKKYSIPRSKVVIMTKLFNPCLEGTSKRPPSVNHGDLVNQMGLSRKHIFEAVEASLRRLDTPYIDVLQLHRLDHEASPEEIMKALHDLVTMGKVHYIGASSMYCWELARLQYTAKMNGWTQFTSMQNLHNLLYREEEREVNPFCAAEGIGLIPWSPVARGLLCRPWNAKTARSETDARAQKWFPRDQQNELIVGRVEELARRKGHSMMAIATAWVLKKGGCPIVGLNSVERIDAAAEALEVQLSDSEVRYLEELYRPVAIQGH